MEASRKERGLETAAGPPEAWLFEGAGGEEYVLLEYPVPTRLLPACLTAAEREVTVLAAEGLTAKEMARRRHRSARTVANQLQSVYRKLGIGSRQELQAWLEAPRS